MAVLFYAHGRPNEIAPGARVGRNSSLLDGQSADIFPYRKKYVTWCKYIDKLVQES